MSFAGGGQPGDDVNALRLFVRKPHRREVTRRQEQRDDAEG